MIQSVMYLHLMVNVNLMVNGCLLIVNGHVEHVALGQEVSLFPLHIHELFHLKYHLLPPILIPPFLHVSFL